MVAGVRSETTVYTSLANIHLWLARNQGAEVDLSGSWLHVGPPITAARAVLCTIWLHGELGDDAPLLAGRLRGLINPRDGSVRLGFDGSAAPELAGSASPATRERVRLGGSRRALDMLELIARDCQTEQLLTA